MTGLLRTANGGYAHPDDPGEPGYGDARARWSVTERECRILSGLAVGRTVLEIGTGLGISTRALARTAESVVTIDVDPWVDDTIARGLPRNVTFLSDRKKLPRDECFSLAFVDGAHEADAVEEDLRFCLGRLSRPGLVVLHDGRMAPVQEGISASGIDLTAAYPLQTEAGLVLIFVGEV